MWLAKKWQHTQHKLRFSKGTSGPHNYDIEKMPPETIRVIGADKHVYHFMMILIQNALLHVCSRAFFHNIFEENIS